MTIIIRFNAHDPHVGRRKVGEPRREPQLCIDGTPATLQNPRWHVGDGYVVALPLNWHGKRPIIQVLEYKPKPIKEAAPDENKGYAPPIE